jgi:hypothetical protein
MHVAAGIYLHRAALYARGLAAAQNGGSGGGGALSMSSNTSWALRACQRREISRSGD